jgi:pyrroloquinoline quinone (PQQ) biosynthesis protein C
MISRCCGFSDGEAAEKLRGHDQPHRGGQDRSRQRNDTPDITVRRCPAKPASRLTAPPGSFASLPTAMLPPLPSHQQRVVDAVDAVDAMVAAALAHRAVRHPYLQSLSAGTLPDPVWALADFARHYEGYSAHFPRYLTALISRLKNPAHRQALLNNLTEESGVYGEAELEALQRLDIHPEWINGVPHPALFHRFRLAVAGPVRADEQEHLEVSCWRDMLLAVISLGSAAEAVGALGLATESIVPTLYQPFLQAIERIGDLHPRDTVFFPLHTAVDDQHQATLRQIAIDYAATESGRLELTMGMHKALALRDSFWSWLHQRAQQRSAGP